MVQDKCLSAGAGVRYTEMSFLKFRKSSYFSLLARLLLAGHQKFEGMFEVEDLVLRLRLESGLSWVRGFVGMLGSGLALKS